MYELVYSGKAVKYLSKLDKKTRQRLITALERSRIKPFKNLKKLTDKALYRLRIGEYRAILDIYQEQLRILVLKIKKRENVYK